MANPSNVSMLIRMVGGNVATPYFTNDPIDEFKMSGHAFIAALQMWSNTEITKQDVVDRYNFTHPDDSGDLDDLKGWHDAAVKQDKFANVLEWRIILARDKRTLVPGVNDLDGAFGYAVKNNLINGADSNHSLRDTGPAAARFNAWA